MALGEVLVIIYTIAMFALALYVAVKDNMQEDEYEDSHYKEEEWQ